MISNKLFQIRVKPRFIVLLFFMQIQNDSLREKANISRGFWDFLESVDTKSTIELLLIDQKKTLNSRGCFFPICRKHCKVKICLQQEDVYWIIFNVSLNKPTYVFLVTKLRACSSQHGLSGFIWIDFLPQEFNQRCACYVNSIKGESCSPNLNKHCMRRIRSP